MDVEQLSQVITHAIAPAFLLGAIAGFISILITRLTPIVDRIRSINEIADDDAVRIKLNADLPRLKRRERLLTSATSLSLVSGICTTLLVIVVFASPFFGLRHEPGAAILFIVSICLLGASLFRFFQEVRISLHHLEHHR